MVPVMIRLQLLRLLCRTVVRVAMCHDILIHGQKVSMEVLGHQSIAKQIHFLLLGLIHPLRPIQLQVVPSKLFSIVYQ